MGSFHDQLFSEIEAARKLAAEFANRHGRSKQLPAAAPSPEEKLAREKAAAAEIASLALEEERLASQARERAKARAEKKALGEDIPTPEVPDAGWSAKAILSGLAKLRAKERSAAEAMIRQARDVSDAEAAVEPDLSKHGQEMAAPPVRAMWSSSHGADQVWYFTSGGTRCGPVTFGELRAMAASKVLDHRHDLVWKEGMDEWKQAGLLDGLYERRAIPSAAPDGFVRRVGKTIAALPKDLTAALASKQMHWPGVGRTVLWLGLLLVPLLWSQILGWIEPILLARAGASFTAKALHFQFLVPAGIIAYLVLMRLVNVGMSRNWAWFLLVPGLNLWVSYRCLACPPGYAHHRKLDRTGVAAAIALMLAIPALWYLKLEHADTFSPGRIHTELHRWVAKTGRLIFSR
jgi:GYF domain 2